MSSINNVYNFKTVPPHITPFHFEGPVNAGESVQLSCYISKGDTPLHIGWHFHGEEKSSSPIEIHTTMFNDKANILSINAVTPEHRGQYICTASNAAGIANFSSHLNVYGCYFFVLFFCFIICFVFLYVRLLHVTTNPNCTI